MIDTELRLGKPQIAKQQRVLAVDDEPAVLALIERMLQSWGYSTTIAHDETECWHVWQQCKDEISTAVLDLRLHTFDGRDLAAALLHDKPNLQVIFMSGYPIELFGDSNLELGKNFVAKPFGLLELRGMIVQNPEGSRCKPKKGRRLEHSS